MTQGDVLGGLLAFSVPALIGNLLHQVYSLTDSIVVGRILGMEALAAVGCTMPLILLLASLMIGTNIGVGVRAFHSLTLIWTAWPLSFAAAGLYLFLHYRKSDIERNEAL